MVDMARRLNNKSLEPTAENTQTMNRLHSIICALILLAAVALTLQAAKDAYAQIETAEALSAALLATDETARLCTVTDHAEFQKKDVKVLQKLNEEGVICSYNGLRRLLWDGTTLVDANCCSSDALTAYPVLRT